jgi:hypothetical protein
MLNQIEHLHNGSLVFWALIMFLEIHYSLQGFILEDLVFKDMNMIGGIVKNWDFYVFYVVLIPMMYYMQHKHFGDVFRESTK